MNTFMADPKTLTDDQLVSWTKNFYEQPPTMDYMVEWSWCQSVYRELAARGLEPYKPEENR